MQAFRASHAERRSTSNERPSQERFYTVWRLRAGYSLILAQVLPGA